MRRQSAALDGFQPVVREWFTRTFAAPSPAQELAWPSIARRQSTLLLAPTGSGKTLAAFLAALDGLLFAPVPPEHERLRVLYVSPLKALSVDIERNLSFPIRGLVALCKARGTPCHVPVVAVRTGDTPSHERQRFGRHPPDILITTPESLYLLLTSQARERLRSVHTVIIDEIHAVAATKRGTHLFLSLERLEALRGDSLPLQRIGLSATQRPLEEIARLLVGGTLVAAEGLGPDATGTDGPELADTRGDFQWRPRPVTVVSAGAERPLELRVEVPVADMARLSAQGNAAAAHQNGFGGRPSIWTAIHPRLLELVRAHRSTLIFVNSRRLAERLAHALNELAGETLAFAHHGSIARERRLQIEGALKQGTLPVLVATSSLELGIDMGAIDLVIQVEAPPSVAAGLQRVGRAGHSLGATSKGVMFPKYRGDLLATAAAVRAMRAGSVEALKYPRNPLDVLAQQIVATVAMDGSTVDALYELVRRTAPFAELSRSMFEGVLDMLSGRYPSHEFSGLRPRLVWDRVRGSLRARTGTRQLAVQSGGTIPERGLFGVFLAGEATAVRVGELDEEMVFESRPGDVFVLGASSWRILEITPDRVLVTPAPGEPGQMPFWHGDRPGRAAEFGQAIGALARELERTDAEKAKARLERDFGLDRLAAENLVEYIADQREAAGAVPSDDTLLLERFVDEAGDWRVCLLSPYGARVHAPWAAAVSGRFREAGTEVDHVWSDDGIVWRFPESDRPPSAEDVLLSPESIERRVVAGLAGTALFAAHFRENAARALLLPRRLAGRRRPLWAQRKKSADLLAVAARYGSFPILLETYRECLRDVFDLDALRQLLERIESGALRLVTVESSRPSPFAASLLFSYASNFIYEGDAPLAERRAQALSLDYSRLRELLGEGQLRELLDAGVIASVAQALGRLDRPARTADELHDRLRELGALGRHELAEHCPSAELAKQWRTELERQGRALMLSFGGKLRLVAVEDASRYRDALGVVLPAGLPRTWLASADNPLADLLVRHARTHTPFTTADVARAFGLPEGLLEASLRRLGATGRVLEGEFTPGRSGTEWCDAEVLARIKRLTLAKLRREVEPVEPSSLARHLLDWQGVTHPRRAEDALEEVLAQLEGTPLIASELEGRVLAVRLSDATAFEVDALFATGAFVWRVLEPLGAHDARVAVYTSERYSLLAPPTEHANGRVAALVRDALADRGGLFFSDLLRRTGVFSEDLARALWSLMFAGEVTNDTLWPLRSLWAEAVGQRRGRPGAARRAAPTKLPGRFSLLPRVTDENPTERRVALVDALLKRHGVLTREIASHEAFAGGFSALYPVLRAFEQSGRVRRGYFVRGLGAAQFALPGADNRLRALSCSPEDDEPWIVISAADPANPYGTILPWAASPGRPGRVAGTQVLLYAGQLVAYLGRGGTALLTWLPEAEPARSRLTEGLARRLAFLVDGAAPLGRARRRVLLIETIDTAPAVRSQLSPTLRKAGFVATSKGLLKRPDLDDGRAHGNAQRSRVS
jgi:ATP-dependent Lhr-like helicase